MMSPFPAEIIDLIIDYLHDDKPSLVACNQTCRLLRPACRYHMFSRIEVFPENLALLHEILDSGATDIAQLVQHVDISDWTGVDGIQNPLPLLVRLPNLHSLSLQSRRRTEPPILSLPNLRHIELVGVRFSTLKQFLRFIYTFPRLLTLSIPIPITFHTREILPETLARYSAPPGQPSFSIPQLNLSNIDDVCIAAWILGFKPPPPMPLVNRLRLVYVPGTHVYTQPLLELVGGSLYRLELELYPSYVGEMTFCYLF